MVRAESSKSVTEPCRNSAAEETRNRTVSAGELAIRARRGERSRRDAGSLRRQPGSGLGSPHVLYEEVPGRPPFLLRTFLPHPVRTEGDKTRLEQKCAACIGEGIW